MVQQVSLDKVDFTILKRLLEDGRASFSSIAKETNLTDVAIKKRVEGLKRKGVISSISVDVNFKVLGFENPIFVQMRSEISKNADLIKKLDSLDYVVELCLSGHTTPEVLSSPQSTVSSLYSPGRFSVSSGVPGTFFPPIPDDSARAKGGGARFNPDATPFRLSYS